MGTGEANNHKAKYILVILKGMSVSAAEFMAVLDAALNVLNDNGRNQPT